MAIELISCGITEISTQSIKKTTFKVTNVGKNIAMAKIGWSGDPLGWNALCFAAAAAKWKWFTEIEKDYWNIIARKYNFYTKWQAFVSSFIELAKAIGIIPALFYPDMVFIKSMDRSYVINRINRSYNRFKKANHNQGAYKQTMKLFQYYKNDIDWMSAILIPKMYTCEYVNEALTVGVIISKRWNSFGRGTFGSKRWPNIITPCRTGFGIGMFGSGVFGTY